MGNTLAGYEAVELGRVLWDLLERGTDSHVVTRVGGVEVEIWIKHRHGYVTVDVSAVGSARVWSVDHKWEDVYGAKNNQWIVERLLGVATGQSGWWFPKPTKEKVKVKKKKEVKVEDDPWIWE